MMSLSEVDRGNLGMSLKRLGVEAQGAMVDGKDAICITDSMLIVIHNT